MASHPLGIWSNVPDSDRACHWYDRSNVASSIHLEIAFACAASTVAEGRIITVPVVVVIVVDDVDDDDDDDDDEDDDDDQDPTLSCCHVSRGTERVKNQ